VLLEVRHASQRNTLSQSPAGYGGVVKKRERKQSKGAGQHALSGIEIPDSYTHTEWN